MKWKQANNTGANVYDLPGDWLKIEYFEALNILFRVENSLRVFVYIILKNNLKEKWVDLSLTSDDDVTSTIKAIARKRLEQDKKYAYLGYQLNSPIVHLTSGELIGLITSNSYWKYFKDYFPGSKEIMKNKLDEIGNVRNSLAHFRPVKKGDIDLVKQNSIHSLSLIEKTIYDFISCPDTVPTNTDSNWYKELSTIGTDSCSLSFKQSKDEKWIKVNLIFVPNKLNYSNDWMGISFDTFNLRSDKLLIHYPKFAKYIISMTESLPNSITLTPQKHQLAKTLNFAFSRANLEENRNEIKNELEQMLLQISQEISLISDDNLARGKIVEVIGSYYSQRDESKYYTLNLDGFRTELDNETPVEFWGTLNYSSKDFITNTEKYPWMSVSIAEDKDFPF